MEPNENIAPRGERNAANYELEDILANLTPEAAHEAFDWGPDLGREIIDE